MRRRAWVAAATGIAIAAAGALAWWAIGRSGPPPAHKVEAGAAHFVGSQACAGCHAAQHTAWQGSQHQLAMQHATPASVLGNFDGAHFTYAGVTSTFFRRDGKYFVRTDGPDGKLADFEIKYTFGVAPLQQYLIELPGGRMQALSIAWDTRPRSQGGQRWYHLYPKERITHTDPLHWTGAAAELELHVRRVPFDRRAQELRRGDRTPSRPPGRRSTSAARPVTAPARRTSTWAQNKSGSPGTRSHDNGLLVRFDERAGVHWVMDAATGNSHAQRAAHEPQGDRDLRRVPRAARADLGGLRAGQPLADTHQPALLTRGLYEADGQMRDEVYNYGSFLQSRMYQQGVTCSDCHDPHSGKLRAPGNGVCYQCHSAEKYGVHVASSAIRGRRRRELRRLPHAGAHLHGDRSPATITASACRVPISR